MRISKKKCIYFDTIFEFINNNNFLLNIELFRKLIENENDNYDIFKLY
jgi:hypothetical protein